jgi:hypothetical protein
MSVLPIVLRWVARVSGLLVAGVYFFMMVGEWLTPHSGGPATVVEWTGIVLMTATCVGMLVAWRWELPGAVISLVCLLGFTLLIRMGHHGVLYVLAVPGTLFLADWLVRSAPWLHKS